MKSKILLNCLGMGLAMALTFSSCGNGNPYKKAISMYEDGAKEMMNAKSMDEYRAIRSEYRQKIGNYIRSDELNNYDGEKLSKELSEAADKFAEAESQKYNELNN